MKSGDLGGPVIETPETFPPRPPFLRVSKVLVFPDQCSSVLISGKFLVLLFNFGDLWHFWRFWQSLPIRAYPR
jgi:hypothetical protein